MEKMNEMIENQEMQVKKKKNNKGFSLVELIIVIAIMAILAGVIGTQVLPYIEKSREARDEQVLSGICTSAVTAFSSNGVNLDPNTTYTVTVAPAAAAAVGITCTGAVGGGAAADAAAAVADIIDLTGYQRLEDVAGDLASHDATTGLTSITISYNAATGVVTVAPAGATMTAADIDRFTVTAQ